MLHTQRSVSRPNPFVTVSGWSDETTGDASSHHPHPQWSSSSRWWPTLHLSKLLQGFWTPATHPGTGANPRRWTGMPLTRCWKEQAVTLLSTTTGTRTENRRRLSWECCIWGRMCQSVSMVVATNNSEIYVTYSAEAFQWSMGVFCWGAIKFFFGRSWDFVSFFWVTLYTFLSSCQFQISCSFEYLPNISEHY